MRNKILLLLLIIPAIVAGQSNRSHGGPSPNMVFYAEESSSSGIEMPFFLSGKSIKDLESLDANSGEYYNLGREYIEAGRNFMSFPIPENVLNAFNDASLLFTIYAASEISNLPYNDDIIKQFRLNANILYNYNKSTGVNKTADCKLTDATPIEDEFFDTDLSQWIYHKSLNKSKITRLY
jgi:hypothetical protein